MISNKSFINKKKSIGLLESIIIETNNFSIQDLVLIEKLSDENNIYCFIHGLNKLVKNKAILKIREEKFDINSNVIEWIFVSIVESYLAQIRRFLIPTIAHEFNLFVEEGFLDQNDKLSVFVKEYSNSTEWIEYFFTKYPVLLDVLESSVIYTNDFAMEFVKRYDNDFSELRKEFGINETIISRIESYQGDLHNNWKTPVKIEYKNGLTIYYKPRDLECERFVYNLSDYLETLGLKKSMGDIPFISKEDYGWMKGIEYKAATSKEDIQEFYFRQGVNLSLFYFISGSDLIGDNILVNQSMPYYFDLECILQPVLTENLDQYLYESYADATHFINSSVLSTNLIPQYGFEAEGFQGISNAGLSLMKEGVPELITSFEGDGFTRTLKRTEDELNNDHIPELKGKKQELFEYSDDLLKGFEYSYQFLMANRSKIISYINKQETNFKIRVLYRPTHVYGKLVSESFLPKYLSSFERRSKLFSYLRKADIELKNNKGVIESEINQIEMLDVPMFHTLPSSKNLYSHSKLVYDGVFSLTGIQSILDKLSNASHQNMESQLKLMKLSFSIHEGFVDDSISNYNLTKKITDNIESKPDLDKSILLDEAIQLEKKIRQNGLSKEDVSSFWGLTQTPQSTWAIRTKNWGVFDGLDGMSLFYLNLYLVTNNKEYLKEGLSWLNLGIEQFVKYKSYYQEIVSFNKIALFVHPISTFYIAEFYKESGIEVAALKDENIEILLDWIEYNYVVDKDYDLLSGSAGTIVYLHKLYKRTENTQILKLMTKLGDYLIDNATDYEGTYCWVSKYGKAFTGLSHGTGGIAYSFLLLHDLLDEERFYLSAIKSIEYERELFDEEKEYWNYFRWINDKKTDDFENHYWAYGSGGILQSRLLISKYYSDFKIKEEIEIATQNIIEKGPIRNHNYSSGLFGNLDTLNNLTEMNSDGTLKSKLKNYALEVVNGKKEEEIWVCAPLNRNNNFVELDGLFSGISGIANTLLNIYDSNKTKKLFYSLIFLCLFSFNSFGQIEVNTTFRVDLSKEDINEVYLHWVGYLNSNPDSIYQNPYWDKEEKDNYLGKGMPGFDRSAMLMYRGNTKASEFLNTYTPTVLSIEEVEENLYLIRTIYYNENQTEEEKRYKSNPPYLTRIYCKKENSKYALLNAINYETKHWQEYKKGYIHYIVHPSIQFNHKKADEALAFCKGIQKSYKLDKVEPFTYYILPDKEALGRLYNFDYWLSYSGGFTHLPLRQIVVSNSSEYHFHEFIHILFPAVAEKKGRPFVINEGLATWLGGPMGEKKYKEEIIKFANEIKNEKDLSLTDILTRKYYHKFDNKPLYLTGAFICELVCDEHGLEGINKLWNCGEKQKEFESVIEELFEMDYSEFDYYIINELKNIYE